MTAPVAVAVVSWNTREHLRACLRSFAPEADAGAAEVWVVDNDSHDGSAEMVGSEFPWVRLIANHDNIGYGAAVNAVAARTDAPWIVASNADVRLAPGALQTLVTAGESDHDGGAVAPRLVVPDGTTQHSVHPFPSLRVSLFVNLGLQRLFPALGDRICLEGSWDPDRRRQIDWAHGALLLLRRRAFDAVGGFDPRQWLYAEDLDLAWRLRLAGWRTLYEPAAVVRHEVSAATVKAFAGERSDAYMQATYTWMARQKGLLFTRTYATVNLAGAAIRWLALAPLAAAAPGRWARSRAAARHWMRMHRLGLTPRSQLLARVGRNRIRPADGSAPT